MTALSVYGINHQTAPLSIREQLALTPQYTSKALRGLLSLKAVNEAVILSTCHRMELYTDSHDRDALTQWLAATCGMQPGQIQPHAYFHKDACAVKHLMRVGSGLESVIVGESQILAQVKQALASASQFGSMGTQLRALFPQVLRVAKKVRTETDIGRHTVSLMAMVPVLAKQLFHTVADQRVLLIGAGEAICLVVKHLEKLGVTRWLFANRTLARAEALAVQHQGGTIPLQSLANGLRQADIVVCATHSPLPMIGKGLLETVMHQRQHRPLLLIDLAVPRNIESEAGQLQGVSLYNVDDLKKIVTRHQEKRRDAVERACHIIDAQMAVYRQRVRAQRAEVFIRDYRSQMLDIRDQSVASAIAQLKAGGEAEEVLRLLGHRLCNRMMHGPCVRMKQVAACLDD